MSNVIKLSPLLFLLMWSSGAIFAKIGLQYTDSWSFLFIRTSIALVLLSFLGYFNLKYTKKPLKIAANKFLLTSFLSNKKEALLIIFSGLLLQICYLISYFFAIKTQMSLGLIILILGLQPILTLILQIKKTSFEQFLLLGFCFIGLSISLFGYYELKELNYYGLFFSFCSLLSITIGTIIQSKTSSDLFMMLWLQTLLAWFIFSIVILMKGIHFEYHWQLILASFWMGGVVSVGAILLLMLMLKSNSVSKVSSLFFMLPILTIFFDSWVFLTSISWLSILGALIVCMSLWMFQKL